MPPGRMGGDKLLPDGEVLAQGYTGHGKIARQDMGRCDNAILRIFCILFTNMSQIILAEFKYANPGGKVDWKSTDILLCCNQYSFGLLSNSA